MDPIANLLNEHSMVMEILDGLEMAARGFRYDAAPPRREAGELLWFLRAYTDGCHHAKEERLLFPVLEANGLHPNMGPTAAMRQEHRLGASLIAGMGQGLAEAGEPGRRRFAHAAESYAGLLRSHIRKEDHCVFALASAILDRAALDALAVDFLREDAAFAAASGGADLARAMDALDLVARWKGRPSEAGRLLAAHPA
jgi:hemerythrin-like domain-containing protein